MSKNDDLVRRLRDEAKFTASAARELMFEAADAIEHPAPSVGTSCYPPEIAKEVGKLLSDALEASPAQGNEAEVLAIADKHLVAAYTAGMNGEDFDMLAAKAAIGSVLDLSTPPAPAPQPPAQGRVTDAMVLAGAMALAGDDWQGCIDDQPRWRADARDVLEAALSTPPAPAPDAGEELQARVQPWMMACFGQEISADKLERSDRFIEEALELVQSVGYSRDRVLALVDYVYGREPGEPFQEVGGVMITLAAFCLAHGMNMHEAGEAELARIWTKVEKIRAKQAAKPTGSALPIPTPQPPAVDANAIAEALLDRSGVAHPRNAEKGLIMRGIRDALAALPTPQPPAVEAEAVERYSELADRLREPYVAADYACEAADIVDTVPNWQAALKAKTDEIERWKLQSDDWQKRGWELGEKLEAAEASNKALQEGRVARNPCIQKLEPDEAFFVLLGRDIHAAMAVRHWAEEREASRGRSTKTEEAWGIADAMDEYASTRALLSETGGE